MNKIKTLITPLIMVLILILAFPSDVNAQSPDGDKIIFGGNYLLTSQEILNGDLVILGGQASFQEGSVVNGDVVLTGGSLDIQGEIKGNVIGIGGSIQLGESAVINGDLFTIGVTVVKSDGSIIKGSSSFQLTDTIEIPTRIPFIRPPTTDPSAADRPLVDLSPIRNLFWSLFQTLSIAAMAILFSLFFEVPLLRIAKTTISQPVLSGSLGLLTAVVFPGMTLLFMITIILIPLGLLAILILGIALLVGWIAIGFETGKKLARLTSQNWSIPVCAGLGTMVLTFVSLSLSWIPCIGWIPGALISTLGLGGVIISRFGTRIEQTRNSHGIPSQE